MVLFWFLIAVVVFFVILYIMGLVYGENIAYEACKLIFSKGAIASITGGAVNPGNLICSPLRVFG